MIVPRHSIFRDKALKHYTQGRKKDVLPDFSSIPVVLFLWVLLILIVATGLLVQYAQVPVYLAGAGIVLGADGQATSGSNEITAIAFISSSSSAHLRPGLSVQIQSSTSNSSISSTITKVESGTLSLAQVFAEYKLNDSSPSLADQPATLIFIRSGELPSAGSALSLNVSIGKQSLFSALLG